MSLFIIALRLEWAVFSKKKARVPDFHKYPDRIVHFFCPKVCYVQTTMLTLKSDPKEFCQTET